MENTFSGNSTNTIKYIAFFDLDQTIANSISGRSLARGAFRKGLLKYPDLLKAIYLSIQFKLNLRDQLKIIDDMISWVKGIPENSVTELCAEVFREVILPTVYEEAVAEIEFHKSKNASIVILSSALTKVCREMADHLKVDDIICSGLEVKDGYMTGRPLGHICFGEEKAVRLLDYCKKNNSSPSEAWYYGDSISDLPALKCVGNPVCVNPDKQLKNTAMKENWKIVSWKTNSPPVSATQPI
jgi:HAD superfamily hydrolase (TIGR01490 family)